MSDHVAQVRAEAASYANVPGHPWADRCGKNPECIIEHGQAAKYYAACAQCQADDAKSRAEQASLAGMRVDHAACAKDPSCRQNDVYHTYQWNGSQWVATGVKYGSQDDALPVN